MSSKQSTPTRVTEDSNADQEAVSPSGENWFSGVLHGLIQASGYCLMLASAACSSLMTWLRSTRTTAPNESDAFAMEHKAFTVVDSEEDESARREEEPEVTVSDALVVCSKKNPEQFFSAYVVSPVTGFIASLTPRKAVERWILFDESWDQETQITQCTTEVKRIVALWQQWQGVKENGYFSQEYKNKQREEIFSTILYDGLVKKLSVDSKGEEVRPEIKAQNQKFLVIHTNVFTSLKGEAFYGSRAEPMVTLFKQAFHIVRDHMKKWIRQPQVDYSAIRHNKILLNLSKKEVRVIQDMSSDLTKDVDLFYAKVVRLIEEKRLREELKKKVGSNDSLTSGCTSSESSLSEDEKSAAPSKRFKCAQSSSCLIRTISMRTDSGIGLEEKVLTHQPPVDTAMISVL